MPKLNKVDYLRTNITELFFKLIIALDQEGDDIALNAYGIERDQVKQLCQLNLHEISRLSGPTFQVIQPVVDKRVLELCLGRIKEDSAQEDFYAELIIHGATLSFLKEFTTIDKHEFTRRRRQFGISHTRKTRAPDIEESAMIDSLWGQLPENMDNIEKYLYSAKKLEIPISKIWAHHKEIDVY